MWQAAIFKFGLSGAGPCCSALRFLRALPVPKFSLVHPNDRPSGAWAKARRRTEHRSPCSHRAIGRRRQGCDRKQEQCQRWHARYTIVIAWPRMQPPYLDWADALLSKSGAVPLGLPHPQSVSHQGQSRDTADPPPLDPPHKIPPCPPEPTTPRCSVFCARLPP